MRASKSNSLFGSDLWTRALERYAEAIHLTLKLFDAEGCLVFEPVHPTPLFELFQEAPGPIAQMFAQCAQRCLEQVGSRRAVVSQSYGLSVIGTSLVLDGLTVGAAVGGYAFMDFSQLSEIQCLARDSDITFERLWQVAREQKPVSRNRLVLNAELLQVLGDALLRENSRTRRYERTVLQLEEIVRAKNKVHDQLQQTAAELRRLNDEGVLRFERTRRIAQAFQDASLPASLPEIPGLAFDAVYEPGRSDSYIGGDWYDAVRLRDGRVIVSIGDVAGSGLTAAVTMGNMRQVIRGVAQMRADPELMLDAAGRALRLTETDLFVTAFVGVIDPIAKTLTYASAGHPPALLRYPGGEVAQLENGGLPLGLRRFNSGGASKVVAVPDGSCLVLYTDGLTEFQRAPLQGELRLRELMSEGSFRQAPSSAATLKELFLDGDYAHDDVALLVVEIGGLPAEFGGPPYRWRLHANDAAAAGQTRKEILEAFKVRGATREELDNVEIVFNEMIANVVRHAPGPLEIVVDWSTEVPVLHMFDRGPGITHAPDLPNDLFSESGRGLFIASAFADAFEVSRGPAGGSQARAVLELSARRSAMQNGAEVATV